MTDDKDKKEVSVSGPKGGLQKYSVPFEEMERMFSDFFQQRFFAPSWMPRIKFPELTDVSTSVDMFEEGNELVIKAEIPGMKKEEISIDFAGDVVTISGEKKVGRKDRAQGLLPGRALVRVVHPETAPAGGDPGRQGQGILQGWRA